jgi:hypothetical protein
MLGKGGRRNFVSCARTRCPHKWRPIRYGREERERVDIYNMGTPQYMTADIIEHITIHCHTNIIDIQQDIGTEIKENIAIFCHVWRYCRTCHYL